MDYERVMLNICRALIVAVFGLIIAAIVVSVYTTGEYKPVAWAHGWKTDRVIATRYESTMIGYTIGFTFPLDYNNSDREEVSDFMENHGGWIYDSTTGEAFTRFSDVKDRATADVKIKQIIGPLTTVMQRMADGLSAGVPKPVEKYTWPDTEAPDKTNPDWKFNNNMTINDVPYWKVEVSPGHWQWQINQKLKKEVDDEEAHKEKVWKDLSTIRMDPKELKEAQDYGKQLNIVPMVPYMEEDKTRELNEAWAVQNALQKQKDM